MPDLAVWVAAAAADRFTVAERQVLAQRLASRGASQRDEITLVTCHRVEVFSPTRACSPTCSPTTSPPTWRRQRWPQKRGAQRWTAFRSISDRPSDGLVDTAVWEMTQIDGSADEDALTRYLRENPEAAARLAQMAADMEVAVNAAAAAAIRACGVEPPDVP
jgi:hypothetical protein